VDAKKTSTYIGNHIQDISSGDIFVIDIAMVSSIPQQSFIVGDVMKTLDDMFSISSPAVLRQDRRVNSTGLKRSPKYILVFIDEINRFIPRTYEQLPGIMNTVSERILRTIIAGRTRGTVLFSAQQFKSMTHPLLHENTGLHITAKLGLSELTKLPYSDLIDDSTRANIVRLNKGEMVMIHPAFRHPIRFTFPDAVLKKL
jgi:DNA helicase HerA-like ATPase